MQAVLQYIASAIERSCSLYVLILALIFSLLRKYYLVSSCDEDIDADKELVAHGYSNLLSGLFWTVYIACLSSLRFQLTILHAADLIMLYM